MLNRDDSQAGKFHLPSLEILLLTLFSLSVGFALKYVVQRLSDNKIAVQGIKGTSTTFDLPQFYKTDSNWVKAKSTSATAGDLTINCSTPALSGASDQTYTYEVRVFYL